MIEISKPERRSFYVAKRSDDTIVHVGYTDSNQVTTSGLDELIHSPEENVHLGNLSALVGVFPDMPAFGESLQYGEIYVFEGTVYMVRQSHNRTEHDPADVPALFLWHRVSDDIDWVAGEQVGIGAHRVYNSVTYSCLQAHVTQVSWEPPNVPALWSVVVAPTADWQVGVSYTAGQEVDHLGVTYVCLQTHTSLVGWEPPNVPAIWSPV
jgi:hypothetical protein